MQRYIELSEIANSVIYENSNSVRKCNAAIDEMYSIVKSLDKKDVIHFFSLLNNQDSRKWIAHHLVELHRLPPEIEDKCFKVVEDLAKSDDLYAYGEALWIEEWGTKLDRI